MAVCLVLHQRLLTKLSTLLLSSSSSLLNRFFRHVLVTLPQKYVREILLFCHVIVFDHASCVLRNTPRTATAIVWDIMSQIIASCTRACNVCAKLKAQKCMTRVLVIMRSSRRYCIHPSVRPSVCLSLCLNRRGTEERRLES